MELRIIIVPFLFVIISCEQRSTGKDDFDWEVSSTENWASGKGLMNVESVIYDAAQQVLYATNGKNYEPGVDGFISKISTEGDILELRWVAGLNRPTGMAIHDSLLYVADVNSLVVINTRNGSITNKYLEPVSNSGINDVAISQNGDVYITASFIHAIFKLDQEQLTMWTQDEESLKWANGIVVKDGQLIVGGLNLSTIDLASKEIAHIKFDADVKDFDGVASDGQNGYFLTTVENSGLYYFDGKNQIYQLMEDDAYFGDIGFNASTNTLYVPRGRKETAEYFISEVNLKQILKDNRHP